MAGSHASAPKSKISENVSNSRAQLESFSFSQQPQDSARFQVITPRLNFI